MREDAKTVAKFTKAEMEGRRTHGRWSPLDEALVAPVQEALDEQYDPKYGGFGYGPNPRQPKFPEPSNLVFLLDRATRGKRRAGPARCSWGRSTWMSTGGHPRPRRRRLSPLQRRSLLADSALRENALRQRPARRRLCRGATS